MNLLHIVESMANAGGGLPAAVKALIKLQKEQGILATCVATSDLPLTDSNIKLNIRNAGIVRRLINVLLICKRVVSGEYEMIHFHGIWNIFFLPICLACFISKTRYVVTTHGQLLSTLLSADTRRKQLKKEVYYFLFGRAVLSGAYRIHVSSENELREFIEKSAYRKKVFYIPHIIDAILFEGFDNSEDAVVKPLPRDVLFVGRLDARKGILELLEGFALAELPSTWRLRIVGPDGEASFMKTLRQRISQADLLGRVVLDKAVYGDARLGLYRSCYVFCLPSYSEAPGLVNIEAALQGRPVLTTPNTGLFQIAENGGMLLSSESKAIAQALRVVEKWSLEEYRFRSARIRAWAKSEYDMEAIIPKWNHFYS